MNGILAGYRKLKELVGDVHIFVKEDQYTLLGVSKVGCKDRSKIVDRVLEEVYKHGDEFLLTVLIMDGEAYKKLKGDLGREVSEEELVQAN
jgi:hypothetical protein